MEYYSKIQIMRINGLRRSPPPCRQARHGVAVLGATNKMFWSETHKEAMELALDIWGAESLLSTSGPESGSWPRRCAARDVRTYDVSLMMSAFFSRSETIWGGTSQIQRNIVGEKVLGLPREPKVEQPKA
jgi:alkylation response protein AidB-like acyl-CoA dehydrogenase